MIKKIGISLIWIAFFGFFLYKYIPNVWNYVTGGFPPYAGNSWLSNRLWFALHISAGVFVYAIGILQFTGSIRNRYIKLHRVLGKVYIICSLICIVTLMFMIPNGSCKPCRLSNAMVTGLWLLFIVSAYYFIRQRKIVQHKRMMIRSFICAAYFVTVRVIDNYAMGIFYGIFPDESTALLVSDIFVWLVPLLCFEIYWRIKDSGSKQIIINPS